MRCRGRLIPARALNICGKLTEPIEDAISTLWKGENHEFHIRYWKCHGKCWSTITEPMDGAYDNLKKKHENAKQEPSPTMCGHTIMEMSTRPGPMMLHK